MKQKMYSVYDAKIGVFNNPMVFLTHGQALRGWMDIANDPSTEIGKHPEDFTLFELAEYDPETGKFENLITPKSHGTALEYKTRAQNYNQGTQTQNSQPDTHIQ